MARGLLLGEMIAAFTNVRKKLKHVKERLLSPTDKPKTGQSPSASTGAPFPGRRFDSIYSRDALDGGGSSPGQSTTRPSRRRYLQWMALTGGVIILGGTLVLALLSLLPTSTTVERPGNRPMETPRPTPTATMLSPYAALNRPTPVPYVVEERRVRRTDGCEYLVSRWSNGYYDSVPVNCATSPQPPRTEMAQQVQPPRTETAQQGLKTGDKFVLPIPVTSGERVDASIGVKGDLRSGVGHDVVLSVYTCDRISLLNELTIVNGYFLSFKAGCSGYYWLVFESPRIASGHIESCGDGCTGNYRLVFESSRTASESWLDVTISYR